MRCFSNEWLNKEGKRGKCEKEAVKQCKHGWWTCQNHIHGCKGEKL